MNPFAFLVICIAGWMNRNQQEVIEYLQEEVRVLKELLGRKPQFNDDQRRRLATQGKRLGRKTLERFPKTSLIPVPAPRGAKLFTIVGAHKSQCVLRHR